MNEYTIKISGNQVLDFISFKMRNGFGYNNKAVKPLEWDIMSNTYTCYILCTEEEMLIIKLKYA